MKLPKYQDFLTESWLTPVIILHCTYPIVWNWGPLNWCFRDLLYFCVLALKFRKMILEKIIYTYIEIKSGVANIYMTREEYLPDLNTDEVCA